MGIPVLKPFLFFGSPPFALHKIVWSDWYVQQHRKLGPTFGLYLGTYKVITTIDPDIIKAVYVKNFEELGDMVDNPHYDDKMKTIDLAQGEEWKSLRKIMTPTFTTGKIKSMLEPMVQVADLSMNHLKALSQKGPVELKGFFQGFALDTICRCAFSIESNAHQDPDHHLVKAGREAFQGFRVGNWMESLFTLLFYFCPGLEASFPSLIYPESFFKLQHIMDEIVDQRIAAKSHYGDFIDKIVETCSDDGKNAAVSSDMIRAQGKIFFAAGFETTSNCLTTLCYHLALNEEVQEKIRQEIKEVLTSTKDEKIDHESVSELHYLEAAIKENLRICPPIILQQRICKKDVQIKGLAIDKGTYVQIPIYACHHNPDAFAEPGAFKPERFLHADNVAPYTFTGFSGGPRICLGMRFAMTEMKVCMAKLLENFKITPCKETELTFLPGDQFMLHYKQVFVNLEKI